MSNSDKPSVLIIGGLGYIGRHLALYIHTNKLASEVRIVDKQLPQLAWLAPEFEEPCKNSMQADMSRESTVEKIFKRGDGTTWDYVFNCGGETRYSQEEEIYKQRCLKLSTVAGKEAAKCGVKLFVEFSDGMVYGKGSSGGSKETDNMKPSVLLAKYKLIAEEELKAIPGLNLLIVRLANVYGPYSSKYLSTVMCNARVYEHLNQEMKWLWTKDLKINTIHIQDIVRAVWHATEWYTAGKKGWEDSWGKTPIFNLVDDGNTSQGTIVDILSKIFKIKTGFAGTLISQLAKLNLSDAVDEANDSVLTPWAEMLAAANITRPGPLTPFLEPELLKDSDLCLDGTRFKNITGFKYEVPKMTEEQLNEMIDSYKKMNWWP